MIFLILLMFSSRVESSTLFLPDSDTAALIMLVSNTASTVVNTMEILETAKDTRDKIDKYNSMAMRRFFMARRIEQHAREIIAARTLRPKGLREINRMLLKLKINLRGLKSTLNLMAENILETDNFVDRYWQKMQSAINDEKEAHRQELVSASEGYSGKAIQNTAMNTALNGKIMSQMRRDQLEYQKVDLGLKNAQAMKQLKQSDFYASWIGLEENYD